ncbi:MAG: hypothetical protein FD146_2759 [Anaerolineaceae bacterium]|nr:MAG: hypothetical protein FD146_2759 [Anaerolineaceae bacterium]
MKRIALLVLLGLLLSACQAAAPAPTPTDTPVPTATFTPPPPTATFTPSPTPAPPFNLGMENVDSMDDCNTITLADIARLHAESLQHYRDIGLIDANGLATEKVHTFYNSSQGITSNYASVPWSYAEISVRIDDPSAITCNIINGNLAYTIPMRAPGSDRVIPLTFMLDQKGMENWYGPEGINRPEGLARNGTEQSFAFLLLNIDVGTDWAGIPCFVVVLRPFILFPSRDRPELMDQWQASKDLLDMFNTQAPWTQPRYPTVEELSSVPTSDLFNFFVGPDANKLEPEYLQAIIDELIKRNPVFPVETLGN